MRTDKSIRKAPALWSILFGFFLTVGFLVLFTTHAKTRTSSGDHFREINAFHVLCMHENIFGGRISDHVELVTYTNEMHKQRLWMDYRQDTKRCTFLRATSAQ